MDITLIDTRKPIRRRRRKNQDRLDKEAERAAMLGVSYGKFKALQNDGLLPDYVLIGLTDDEDKEPPETVKLPEIPKKNSGYKKKIYDERPCIVCGKLYRPKAINSKYCSEGCRREGSEIRAMLWRRKHRKQEHAEAPA